MPDVPVVLSVAASFGVSSSSVYCACEDEDAEDDYDQGPEEVPEVEVGDVSG